MKDRTNRRRSLWWDENRYLVTAFVAAAILVLITYALFQIWPFGDQIILKIDMYHQYAPFHEELRSRLLHGQSLIYSWEGALGKEMLTQIAYYTASPLTILMLLFSTDTLPEAMEVLILLKIALSSLTFAWYLKKKFGKNDWSLVIFGLFYASCSYVTAYHWNVMWLDAVYLFPLVALGIETLVKEGRSKLYVIALALTIFTNFYIAFLVCVISVLYFIMVLVSVGGLRGNWKRMFHRIFKFGIASLLAGGLCMLLVIPTYLGLAQTAVADTRFPEFQVYQNIWQILENHFLGARPVVLGRNQDLPNIYCGVFPMLLVPFYYLDRHYPLREKISVTVFQLVLLACCCLRQLDFLIHGMHWPANLPHRFSFIYSFVLLVIAYKAYVRRKHADRTLVPVFVIFYAAVILVSEFVIVPRISGISRVYDNLDLGLNALAFIVYSAYLMSDMRRKTKPKHWLVETFLVLILAECVFSQVNGFDRTTSRTSYLQYNQATRDAEEWMEIDAEGRFYRTEFTKYTIINEGSYHHYNGISQFSSLAPEGICVLMGKLGTSSTGNSYRLGETTPVLDAMLSLRYRMHKSANATEEKEYPFMDFRIRCGNVAIYENERVLPLAYMVSENVLKWNASHSSPFFVQNDFMSKATGMRLTVFDDMVPVSTEEEGITVTSPGTNSFSYRVDTPEDLSVIPTLKVHLESSADQYLYLYVKAGNANKVLIDCNGEESSRSITTGNSILDIGPVSQGDPITLTFELTDKGEFELQYRATGSVTVYAAGYRDENFTACYEKLMESPLMITSFEDTRIAGEVNAEEGGILMTSIPYCQGWSASVDGEETEIIPIGNGFLGIRVAAGSHQIVFRFEAPGLKEGLVISFLSLLLVICLFIDEKLHPADRNWRDVAAEKRAAREAAREAERQAADEAEEEASFPEDASEADVTEPEDDLPEADAETVSTEEGI